MKFRFFEFEDQLWLPNAIREGMTDYLRFIFNTANLYHPITPILADTFAKSGSSQILDLCSGSGGAIQTLQAQLEVQLQKPVTFILSDKFPNLPAFNYLKKSSRGKIDYIEHPVDATCVPHNVKGFRTIFSGFHHFNSSEAQSVLKNAMDANEGIAVFDGGDKNIFIILVILIGHPLLFLILTPFIRPFSFTRLLFTYIIPLIPLCTVWDGIISILRLYSPKRLLQLTEEFKNENYTWKAGKVTNRFGMNISFLTGTPLNPLEPDFLNVTDG